MHFFHTIHILRIQSLKSNFYHMKGNDPLTSPARTYEALIYMILQGAVNQILSVNQRVHYSLFS